MAAETEDCGICTRDASVLLPQARQQAIEQNVLPQNDHKVPDGVVVLLPAHQETTEAVASPEADGTPSEHDKAVGIAEKMKPANWPLSSDMQVCIEELKEPTELPDNANNCSLPCSIPCKDNWCEPLVYRCDNRKCIAVRKGTKSVLQRWTDGLISCWKLLYIFSKILFYFILWAMVTAKFSINVSQEKHIVFDAISFVFSLLGFLISFVYAMVFVIQNRKDILIIIRDSGVYVVLKIYKYCCCKKKFSCVEELKEKEEKNCEHRAAEKYVNEGKKFKLPQNSFQEFTVLLGNTSEILITIVDDIILTVVFLLSFYSFLENQDFTIFYGSIEADHRLGFAILVLSALKLIFFVHGLRMFSIAVNVRALDKKVERDSEVMQVKLPNKFIRYFLSLQSRLVSHTLLSSAFQIYGIFALSWKIIQDNCNVVATPSVPTSNRITGAPFTCSIPPLVNGFTIYNILYIAMVPTLLGYTSFFVCNTPWLVEYMQTITMWTYLQIEYMTGVRVREDDKDGERVKTAKMVETVKMVERVNMVERVKTVEEVKMVETVKVVETVAMVNAVVKDAYIHVSPQMQLLKIFCSNELCNITDEELKDAGARAECIRETIQEDYEEDAEKYGINPVSRVATKLGQVTLCMPAAIIGVLQVILFIIHIVFMGCGTSTCFGGNIHTVLSAVASDDVAAVLVPLTGLFLLTSCPGPWIGVFWLLVVFGVLVIVAAIVAFAAIVIGGIIFIVLCVCLGTASTAVAPE